MKNLKFIVILIGALLLLSFASYNIINTKKKETITYQCPMKCEGSKTYTEPGNCKVCNMKLQPITDQPIKLKNTDEISETSIFNLTSKWHTQNNKTIELKNLKGQTLIFTMIYTTCKISCPRLVADIRNIEKQIPSKLINKTKFVFVSIDPETDTPKRLKAYAKENFMEDNQWVFLQGTENNVREFANVLAVKYKQISPINFSHSNIISVINPQGELVYQQEGIKTSNKEIVSKIIDVTTGK